MIKNVIEFLLENDKSIYLDDDENNIINPEIILENSNDVESENSINKKVELLLNNPFGLLPSVLNSSDYSRFAQSLSSSSSYSSSSSSSSSSSQISLFSNNSIYSSLTIGFFSYLHSSVVDIIPNIPSFSLSISSANSISFLTSLSLPKQISLSQRSLYLSPVFSFSTLFPGPSQSSVLTSQFFLALSCYSSSRSSPISLLHFLPLLFEHYIVFLFFYLYFYFFFFIRIVFSLIINKRLNKK
jgi:hypothetical protein